MRYGVLVIFRIASSQSVVNKYIQIKGFQNIKKLKVRVDAKGST